MALRRMYESTNKATRAEERARDAEECAADGRFPTITRINTEAAAQLRKEARAAHYAEYTSEE